MDTTINPTPAPEETNEQGATQAATNGAALPEPKKPTKKKAKPEPKAPKGGGAKAKPATQKPPKDAGAKATPEQSMTLGELAQRYVAKLTEDGKSEGTLFSYRMELRLALVALGENTSVAKLTRPKVAAFFESDPVCKTRTGLPKSPLSIAKTHRVLRQALNFAVELGLIEKAPLPE